MSSHLNYPHKHLLGLIGRPLAHSFSKDYFYKKFEQEEITDFFYDLFPISSPHFLHILKRDNPNLLGLNVTIPYKESVIDFLHTIDEAANEIGAVNTIMIEEGKMIGYNTDVIGFSLELDDFIRSKELQIEKALILGTGGASKAIKYVLNKKGIDFRLVSRTEGPNLITYKDIDETCLKDHQLIVNTTPLGTYPRADACPDIPYHLLNENHALFDLVYNPEKTLFLARAEEQGSAIRNGFGMLKAQAEASWDIWTK